MRKGFAHRAVVDLDDGDDPAAPGAAITVALCGDPDHAGPCPLAAHRTEATGTRTVLLRTVFVTEPGEEAEARRRIHDALAGGTATGPDGSVRRWRLRTDAAAPLEESEGALVARLTAPGAAPLPR